MQILSNISLKNYNTFGLDVYAKEFVEIEHLEDLLELIPNLKGKNYIFLGGGSNILFTQDYDGLVILNKIKGITKTEIEDKSVIVEVKSGEIWHEFVMWTLENDIYGLENLSLIPGTIGAGPMQNIGAYGVEIKQKCIQVDAIHLQTGKIKSFTGEECQFGYRESVFKRALKNQYFIYSVHFSLSRIPNLKMEYGDIKAKLAAKNIESPSPRDISNAIIEIRSSKLPDFKELGNAGSFFKNPVVATNLAENLKAKYSEMPSFPDANGVKIPAGWLIEKAEFKGKRVGNTGSHKDQALVIVNYGGATGIEILNYSSEIISKVRELFGIELEREVNIV